MELCYRIIEQFYSEASKDSRAYIVHLPVQNDLEKSMNNKKFEYDFLLNQINSSFNLISPTDDLIKEAKKTSLDNLFTAHYSATANKIIADVIYKKLKRDLLGNTTANTS